MQGHYTANRHKPHIFLVLQTGCGDHASRAVCGIAPNFTRREIFFSALPNASPFGVPFPRRPIAAKIIER